MKKIADIFQQANKKIMCCVVALVLVIGLGASAFAARSHRQGDAEEDSIVNAAVAPAVSVEAPITEGEKRETLFVTLDASGAPNEVIVSGRIHAGADGDGVYDTSSLSDLVALKGGSLLSYEDNTALWHMEDEDLYYQGRSDAEIPLDVSIRYTLDGVEYSPEEIAGRSGRLEIQIGLTNNLRHTVEVSGQPVEMTAPLSVVLGMVLPDDTFSGVEVSDGNVTADGSNQIVAIVAMPGLEDSLGIKDYDIPGLDELNFPDSFTVTADVRNFEMGSIYIGATTGFPELGFDSEEIEDMRDDLGELQGIQNDLSANDQDRQIRSIFMDPWMTQGTQTMVDDIFDFYDMDKLVLDILPDYINTENIALYDRFREHSDGIDMEEALFGDTADALFDFLEGFSRADAEKLLDDRAILNSLTDNYTHLLRNDDAESLAIAAGELAESAQGYSREIGALTAMGRSLNAGQLDRILDLYAQSGLGNLDPAALSEMLDLYQAAQKMGLMDMDPAELSQLLSFYQTSGLAQCTGLLPELMGQVEAMGGLSPDEWQTLFGAGLQAVADMRGGQFEEQAEEPIPQTPEEQEGAAADDEENQPDANEGEPDSEPQALPDDEGAPAGEEPAAGDNAGDSADAHREQDAQAETASDESNQAGDDEQAGSGDSAVMQMRAYPRQTVGATPIPAAGSGYANTAVFPATAYSRTEVRQTGAADIDVDALRLLLAEISDVAGNSAAAAAAYGYDLSDPSHRAQLLGCVNNLSREAQSMMRALENLGDDDDAMDELEDLLDILADGKGFSRLRRLQRDLQANRRNLDLAEALLHNPDIDLDVYTAIEERSALLRQDLRDLQPIYISIRDDFDDDAMQASLHSSPETVATLMQMKDDMEEYRAVSEALRTTVSDKNAAMFSNMFSTLDRLDAEGAIDRYVGQVDDILELIARKDAYVALAEEQAVFTDAPEGFDASLHVVMKTQDVRVGQTA